MKNFWKKTYGVQQYRDVLLAMLSVLFASGGRRKWRAMFSILLVCASASMSLVSAPAEAASIAPIEQGHQLITSDDGDTEDMPSFDDANNWNFPNRHYFRCVYLKNTSAPLRYSDFSPISATGDYSVLNSLSFSDGSCQPGQVRLDARELLQTSRGRIYFHKGGHGYRPRTVPYGHLWIGDIRSGTAPSPQVPTSRPPEYGAPSAIPGTDSWDWERRNGRGCTPTGSHNYRIHITRKGTAEEIPSNWQYKENEDDAHYNKYADAGAEQSSGTEHYGYIVWSWMHEGDGRTENRGGGMVRSLIREGQPFYRCGVDSINSIAYDENSTRRVGRVRAIYGKTRASADGPWVYGWIIHSHKANGERWVYHVTTCPNTGC